MFIRIELQIAKPCFWFHCKKSHPLLVHLMCPFFRIWSLPIAGKQWLIKDQASVVRWSKLQICQLHVHHRMVFCPRLWPIFPEIFFGLWDPFDSREAHIVFQRVMKEQVAKQYPCRLSLPFSANVVYIAASAKQVLNLRLAWSARSWRHHTRALWTN